MVIYLQPTLTTRSTTRAWLGRKETGESRQWLMVKVCPLELLRDRRDLLDLKVFFQLLFASHFFISNPFFLCSVFHLNWGREWVVTLNSPGFVILKQWSIQGVSGPKGERGDPGPIGPDGEKGSRGKRGKRVLIYYCFLSLIYRH